MLYDISKKVILTDCDGVLVDWEYSFSVWMRDKGHEGALDGRSMYNIMERYNIEEFAAKQYVKEFNESIAIRHLPPQRDAIHGLRKLHEEYGYVFHVITSLSLDPYSQQLRRENLERLFGQTAIEKFIYTDTNASKEDALEPYMDTSCWWIEDHPGNCDVGLEIGLRSLLMHQQHNSGYRGDAPVVNSWKEITHIIVR